MDKFREHRDAPLAAQYEPGDVGGVDFIHPLCTRDKAATYREV